HDAELESLVDDPLLELDELDVQLGELALEVLAGERLAVRFFLPRALSLRLAAPLLRRAARFTGRRACPPRTLPGHDVSLGLGPIVRRCPGPGLAFLDSAAQRSARKPPGRAGQRGCPGRPLR